MSDTFRSDLQSNNTDGLGFSATGKRSFDSFVGFVYDVNPLNQTINVMVDGGALLTGVEVAMPVTAGERGMALPTVGALVMVVLINGAPYCTHIINRIYSRATALQKGERKYNPDSEQDKIDIRKNNLEKTTPRRTRLKKKGDSVQRPDNKELLKDEFLLGSNIDKDPDSIRTHKELVVPGDSAIFRGSAGNKIIATDDGLIAIVSSADTRTVWDTKEDKIRRSAKNFEETHPCGSTVLKTIGKTVKKMSYLEKFSKNNFELDSKYVEVARGTDAGDFLMKISYMQAVKNLKEEVYANPKATKPIARGITGLDGKGAPNIALTDEQGKPQMTLSFDKLYNMLLTNKKSITITSEDKITLKGKKIILDPPPSSAKTDAAVQKMVQTEVAKQLKAAGIKTKAKTK